ncbi:MAG: DNA-binding response regulator [Chloroflexi bacterium RBG_19FT_COMBO_49_13]|nr:MAG: DNA-binding response regulator [Chloroflexi bacterium RBG_19FT_COMBO_49_13]
MSKKILIVDDEPRYVRLIEANLITDNYQVLKAYNGEQALELVANENPDLVLLDIMMPILDGFTVCERIRKFSTVPIIMVTVKGEEQDRVRGLDIGADDYIVKPFSATEVLARVRAVLRRAAKPVNVPSPSIFHHGDMKIELAKAEVFLNGKKVYLSATEYRILLQLAQNVGSVLPSEQLLRDVWGVEYQKDKEILWVSISRLRQKLEADQNNPQHIVTRSGVGYIMPVIQEKTNN